MFSQLLRKKPINPSSRSLAPTMNGVDLTFMGIGGVIGAGVFVLTGIAAATKAGPAIMLSYIFAGFAAMMAAFAYAELAAAIGGTGSAYSFAYAGFGEIMAWVIGWTLLLEYIMGVSTIAIGWSGYVNNFLQSLNIHLPDQLVKNPFQGGVINLLASLIMLVITTLLCMGLRHSVRFNYVIVLVKLITIAVFILVASFHVNAVYWENFFPFGWAGVFKGAAFVFFAYIGFDALSTAAEETIDPQRNVPIGIIATLVCCTLIYIAVSGLLTSIVPYTALNVKSPVAEALLTVGSRSAAGLIAAGAIAGLTTSILVMFYALTRISFAMARDGLLPVGLATINAQTHSPVRVVMVAGCLVALISGFAPIERVAELVNIGTLAAFIFVCTGVIVLRITQPELKRPFRLPWNPLIPLLGILSCGYLLINLPPVTWNRYAIWMTLGLVVYFLYGVRHSTLRK